MERSLLKIITNSEQIKEECDAIQKLLLNILKKNTEAVKDVKNCIDREITLDKKYLLGLLDDQYLAIKKLTEIDIELDEFSKHAQLSNIDFLSSRSESSITQSTCSCDSSNKTTTPSVSEVNKLHPLMSEENYNFFLKRKCTLSLVTLPPCSYETSSTSSLTPTRDIGLISQSAEVCEPENIFTNENTNENVKESSSGSSSDSNKSGSKKSSADISSSDEISQKSDVKKKTVQEKIKSKKLMTRRDRHLQNIERPEVPDLSFKPSSKTIHNKFHHNENYITCPESSSSTSATKLVEKRRRKRRSAEHELSTSVTSEQSSQSVVVGVTGDDARPVGDSACQSQMVTGSNMRKLTDYQKELEPYVNMLCLVSRVVSPSEFYINVFDDNIGIIDAIAFQLAEVYRQTHCPFEDKKQAMTVLGNDCVAYLEEYEAWYRVVVTNWRLKAKDYQEDLVTVYLVDYGHVCNTSYKKLRELTEEFCNVPKYAIKCHLAWLYPPGSTKDNLLETWPKKTLEYFSSLFKEIDKAIFRVVYAEKCGNAWGIDLRKHDNTSATPTYGELLIDGGMALEIFQDPATLFRNEFFLKQLTTAQGLAGISSGMDNAEKLEKFHENTGVNEASNIDQAMLHYKATDEARICKHTRPDGTCFKGKRCKLEHGKLRPDGYTTDKQCIYVSAFENLKLPEVNSIVKLQITNVISVNTFYACLVNTQSDEFTNLIRKMNKSDVIAKYKPLEIIPACGELVIVKNWNNYWYRAQVKDIYHYIQNVEETVQVFIVDLGEIVDSKLSELRLMEPEFLYLPFQAVLCRLYNVNPKQNQDMNVAKSYCESRFLCQIFNAEVKYASLTTLEVLLKKENNEDAGEQIIEEGYGELRIEQIYPAETLLVD